MSKPTFQCPECRRTGDYYETRKTLDPRMLPKCRTICQECADRIEAQSVRLDRDPYDGPDGIGTKGEVSCSDLAASLTGSRIAEAKYALLVTLSQDGPMAAEPASRAAGLDPDYGSPRLSTLLADGLLEVVDRKGVSDRGNPCGRYTITPLGRQVLDTFRRAA